MAEKDNAAERQQDDKEPDFSDVEFEGEPKPEGAAETPNEDDGGEGDERLGEREGIAASEGGRAGETADEKKARRVKERQDKKARIQSERKELAEFRRLFREQDQKIDARIAGVEKRLSGTDLTAIDGRLDVLRRIYANAEIQRRKAMTEGNGEEFDKADKALRDAEREYERLTVQRTAITNNNGAGTDSARQVPEGRQQADEARPDPKVARLANAFINDFPDYDPDGSDELSSIVQALDAAVTAEGFDPRTKEYWDELRERVQDRIPEWSDEAPKRGAGANGRRAANGNGRQRARAIVAGSGRDGGGEGGGGAKYVLSALRVQAIKDAGKWDDPKARAKMIESFRAWDKDNAQQRSA